MSPVRIFDFDGTLSHNGHRRHLKGLPYLELRDKDRCNVDVLEAFCAPPLGARTVIVTGRDPGLAIETTSTLTRWLNDFAETTRVTWGDVPRRHACNFSPNYTVSYRAPGHDGPPLLGEKVDRIRCIAEMQTVHGDDYGVPADILEVYEDERAVLDELVALFHAHKLVATTLILHHVQYAGSERIPGISYEILSVR